MTVPVTEQQEQKRSQHPLHIWLLSDDRPGHTTQLEGLATRLQARNGASVEWLRPAAARFSPPKPPETSQTPDIIIGAGHSTHKALYSWSRKLGAFSVVLMKPSLPLRLFNAVICPAHDGLRSSSRVFNTLGVINKIEPPAPSHKEDNLGSILIGGPSRHYLWESEHIKNQIRKICQRMPNINWQIFDSPRTPHGFVESLQTSLPPSFRLWHWQDSNAPALAELLRKSRYCWVSPDSASMIYEALTAGCSSALLDLKPSQKKTGRIVRGVRNLLEKSYLCSWQQWQQSGEIRTEAPEIWEADRAAQWLLESYAARTNKRRLFKKRAG